MHRRALTYLLVALIVPIAAALAMWSATASNADTRPDRTTSPMRGGDVTRPDIDPLGPGPTPATAQPEGPENGGVTPEQPQGNPTQQPPNACSNCGEDPETQT